ncbi:putative nuclease HARBI1 isoform X2 [Temnothorax curvispinosus]|uniref:Putative nuclease HARBI1 n=1 Tax=Temnothorax curvispinosus TaxID=300111 RepID=A0A6J1R638_9HYME|nr:putative nuclease HARBI1 isoform X2 [Temnothorax curvispinosus]
MDNEFLNDSDSDDGFEDENVENDIRWRLPKRYILNEQLQRNDNRGLPISPIMQLLITLRFYATSSFQIVNGDIRGVSQASVSCIVARVSTILASHLKQYINFSTQQRQRQNTNRFYEVANFPRIIGCIDCTHIRIANPGGNNGEIFRNRKGWFSLNVQVVCGPQREILDIVVRHPGSAHDAVIFDRSSVRCRFELGYLDGILLGDSGYACRKYLLTPVLRPDNNAEIRYNNAHKKTRVIIEQLFGVWKRRFPCLYYGLRTKLSTSVAIICATAVLHNICIYHGFEEIEQEHNEQEQNEVFEAVFNREEDGIGLTYRRAFILRHFS